MSLNQEVDSIIAEENLSDANLAAEEAPNDIQPEGDRPDDGGAGEQPSDRGGAGDAPVEGQVESEAEKQPDEDKKPEESPAESTESPSKTVEEAKSFIQNLNLTDDKVFNEDGSVKPWREVVPPGKFLASQLEPVVVTDKDGKTHEFMLLSDVEKAFPEGFEAKNNIEQMKFQQAILDNEAKFKSAVKTYNDAEARYVEDTDKIVQERGEGSRLRNEYLAMAEQGIVPKVGDPSDPKFAESDAVKEMNRILEWMDKTNAENAKKGLGQVTSLYYAKQLMDLEDKKTEKEEKKNEVIQQRNHVASLSSSPTPADEKRTPVADVPLSRLADTIIQEEGLR